MHLYLAMIDAERLKLMVKNIEGDAYNSRNVKQFSTAVDGSNKKIIAQNSIYIRFMVTCLYISSFVQYM